MKANMMPSTFCINIKDEFVLILGHAYVGNNSVNCDWA